MIVWSLFDSTGTWAAFAPPGATVYAIDLEPKPLEWAQARGVQHVQANVCDLLKLDLPRPDVLLCAPPCQALSNMRHVRTVNGGKPTEGVISMTTEEGLALVRLCVRLATWTRPTVWCVENPRKSLAWSVLPMRQMVLWGWYGYPAEKPTGLGGDFQPVAAPFPLPFIDPTEGGRRPCAARPGVGGVQAMPSYLRSRTPPAFAQAWWAAQASVLERLRGAA